MGEVAPPPADGRGRIVAHEQASLGALRGDEGDQLRADGLQVAGAGVAQQAHLAGQCLGDRTFLAHAARGATRPVGIRGGDGQVARAQPIGQAAAAGATDAVREHLAQPAFGDAHELVELSIAGAVAITQERQVGRQRGRRRTLRGEVAVRRVDQDRETCEMQRIEVREGQQAVQRIRPAGPDVHLPQHATQRLFVARLDLGDDHEVSGRDHGVGPMVR